MKKMHKTLNVTVLFLLLACTAAKYIEGREARNSAAGQDTLFIHPFLLDMQKCLSAADGSLHQCCGIEANEVRTVAGRFDDGAVNHAGDEVHINFNTTYFTANAEGEIQHVQLLVHKGSSLDDSIVALERSGCAKDAITLLVRVIDSKMRPGRLTWNLTLPLSGLTGGSWIRFELDSLKWLHFNTKVLQMAITINCNANLSGIISSTASQTPDHQPYLFVYRKISTNKQSGTSLPGRHQAREHVSRRSANIEFATSDTCGLRRYEVNVSAVFGDAVLYPKTYEANYCEGKCEDPENNTSLYQTSHARVQYYLYVAQRSLPPPRCVVRGYTPTPVLFSEDNGVVLHLLNDISASSCQCL